MLAAFSGLPGILLAPMAAQLAAAANQNAYTMRGVEAHLDLRILSLGGVLFALAPARFAARVDLTASQRDGLPDAGRIGSRLRGGLIAAQTALSLVLPAGAGTGIATMRRALGANPVAQPDDVLLASMDPDVQGYSAAKGLSFYTALLEGCERYPALRRRAWGRPSRRRNFLGAAPSSIQAKNRPC